MTKSRGIRPFSPKGSVEDRFWSKVNKKSKDECWEWQGKPNTKGYGRFIAFQKIIMAHRYSWELHNGNIPINLDVLHHCDNPKCVNPSHLFLGTNNDNIRDMCNKGRQRRGEIKPCAKLKNTDIPKIRELRNQGFTYKKLSEMFGIAQGQLCMIVQRKAWAHIP